MQFHFNRIINDGLVISFEVFFVLYSWIRASWL